MTLVARFIRKKAERKKKQENKGKKEETLILLSSYKFPFGKTSHKNWAVKQY